MLVDWRKDLHCSATSRLQRWWMRILERVIVYTTRKNYATILLAGTL